jgi:hypothetical protein
MFFEGAFASAGLDLDYADFSVRLPEDRLHELVERLVAVRVGGARREGHVSGEKAAWRRVELCGPVSWLGVVAGWGGWVGWRP